MLIQLLTYTFLRMKRFRYDYTMNEEKMKKKEKKNNALINVYV